MTLRPKNIQVSKKRGLLIVDWEDGHHSEYPLAGLRAACPCATCKGGHENMGGPGSPEMLEVPLVSSKATELAEAEIVGNYAINLRWMDGHRYGIYGWEYLRQLCPCGEHETAGSDLGGKTA